MHVDASRLELRARTATEVVVPERRVEVGLVGEQRELDRCDPTPASRLLPVVGRVGDLARPGQPLDPGEPGPLDMPDNGDLHVAQSVTDAGGSPRPSGRYLTERVPPPFHG